MKRDDTSSLYEQSAVLGKYAQFFFWANILCMSLSSIPSFKGAILSFVQAIFPILFLITSVMDDCFCWYNAESERRKNIIEHAFGVDLSEYKTEGYYNNKLPPSLEKFIVDSFESIFFTKSIVKQMLKKEILKAIVSVMVIVFIMLFAEIATITIVFEGVLSAYLLLGSLMIIVFYNKIKTIFNNLYRLLISEKHISKENEVLAFSEAFEYEACKAYFKIRVNSKHFKQMNKKLSAEWKKIKTRIRA